MNKENAKANSLFQVNNTEYHGFSIRGKPAAVQKVQIGIFYYWNDLR
jgi:hypothetical protein